MTRGGGVIGRGFFLVTARDVDSGGPASIFIHVGGGVGRRPLLSKAFLPP
jgi:hypothetical protein